MDSENIIIDSDMFYPILCIPRTHIFGTTLATNAELSDNMFINIKIASRDAEGTETIIYSGFTNIKVVDSYSVNASQVATPGSSTEESGIEQMPVILSETNQLNPPYSPSNVWIDPSRSPYVFNTCGPWTQEQCSIREAGELTTVQQHNTYITQNVLNCKESNALLNYKEASQSPVKDFECKRHRKVQEIESTAQTDANLSYDEQDEECGVFPSQQPEEIMNETQSRAREEKKAVPQKNSALKQLMSSHIQSTSKQTNTILFVGHDSHSGQTIQNISYNEPLVTRAEMEVMNRSRPTDLNEHQHLQKTVVTEPEQEVDYPMEEFYLKSENGKFGSRSNQEASGDFSRPNRELERSDNLAGSKRDLSRSSREFVRSIEESMDIERELIREADSEIAKVISNEIFFVSSKKGKRNTSRKTCEVVCPKPFDRIDELESDLISSTLAKSPTSRTGSLKITCEGP